MKTPDIIEFKDSRTLLVLLNDNIVYKYLLNIDWDINSYDSTSPVKLTLEEALKELTS